MSGVKLGGGTEVSGVAADVAVATGGGTDVSGGAAAAAATGGGTEVSVDSGTGVAVAMGGGTEVSGGTGRGGGGVSYLRLLYWAYWWCRCGYAVGAEKVDGSGGGGTT